MPDTTVLTSTDQTPLGAMRYQPTRPNGDVILVAGATAVPQGFYRRFAEFAADRGNTVCTFDYRGVGLSAPKSLRGYHADYLDWGQKDLQAAINWASAERAETGRLYMVGHSFAGHGFGMVTNHQQVHAAAIFGTGAGYAGYMPVPERYRVWLLWHVLGPILTRIYGCLPFKLLGMGENLPMGVYRQWRHWCSMPHYFFDDPKAQAITAGFADVRTPMLLVNAVDDLWAPPISRDAFVKGYPRVSKNCWNVQANETDLQSIGHMGYFRPGAAALWRKTLDWFAEQAR
jgi:predicted alpha/beta hydrolase